MNLWNAKFAQVVFNNLLTRFQSPVIFTQRLKLLLLFRTKAIFVKKKNRQFFQFFHYASGFEKVLRNSRMICYIKDIQYIIKYF